MDFTTMSAEELTAALNEAREKATQIFALESVNKEQADEAEALVASIAAIEKEQDDREKIAQDAADRFAKARAAFSTEAVNDGVEEGNDAEDGDEGDEGDEGDSAEDGDESVEAASDAEDGDEGGGDEGEVTTAAAVNHRHTQTAKVSAAKRVGSKVKRPTVAASQQVTITAAADIPNVATGSEMEGMTQVASAIQSRLKGIPKFNARAAQMVHETSGGQPVLNKMAIASFGLDFEPEMTAKKTSTDKDYSAVHAAIAKHKEAVKAGLAVAANGKAGVSAATLTAAGWCAPSPYVYNWIADYVVDGLMTLPEVSAPRGGLQITQGPQLAQGTYADPADFGFGGTEAQAIAGYTKTCETIECPDFVDHRLDFTGYCWKIPILTEKAFPELVADALRLSDVLYAHKMNSRFIADVVAGSTEVDATNALGGVFLDTLEAFTQVAIKERRWWNIGENAPMEIKLPQIALDIFKFDMARRSGLALDDIATDQKVAAHFANHNFSVEYVSDWQDPTPHVSTVTVAWPETLKGIMYPAGTWAKAVEDVINLSAVYDAASLSQNEYTGVFFEQGVMTLKMGYRSHVIEVPVCVAGRSGANDFTCAPAGSF